MKTRLASTLSDTGLDERQWNQLAACSETNTVFQTHQWTHCWWETFGQEHEPFFVTACNSSGVTGIAPLVRRRGTGRRVLRFLGEGRADYCDVLTAGNKDDVVRALLGRVLEEPGWDVLDLNGVPSHSRTLGVVEEHCRRLGYRLLREDTYLCPTLLIRGREDEARRIGNKPSLRRRENYFRRQGRLACRHLTDMSEVEPYLDRFFDQHINRWRTGTTQSLFLDARNRRFYLDLARRLTDRAWLLFSVVEFEDEPIAFHYGFDYGDTVIWYKPSFDTAHASRSPGLVMVRNLILYALDRGRRELDFTIGDEPFKARFTNSARNTARVRVYRNAAHFAIDRSGHLLLKAFKSLQTRHRNGNGQDSR